MFMRHILWAGCGGRMTEVADGRSEVIRMRQRMILRPCQERNGVRGASGSFDALRVRLRTTMFEVRQMSCQLSQSNTCGGCAEEHRRT